MKTLPRLAAFWALTIFILLMVGAWVRSIGAGLACPDWPKCNGAWFPPLDPMVFAEWFHRLLASVVSVLTLAVAVTIWRNPLFRALGKWATVAVLMIVLQIVMGGLTVLGLNAAHIVTAHLVIGALFLGVSVVIWQRARILQLNLPASPLPTLRNARPFRKHVIMALVMVLIQIALGGLVSTNFAGLVCPDFPTCNGSWWPPFEGLVRYQMLHRLGAYATFLVVAATVAFAWRLSLDRIQRRLLRLVTFTLILQFLLGIGLLHAQLPLAMRIAHQGVAMFLFAALTALAVQVYRR